MIKPKAILLDFYGTVVEEDEKPVTLISKEISEASNKSASLTEVASYWWRVFGELFTNSHGGSFQKEKELGQSSALSTMKFFDADLDGEKLIQKLSDYWDEYWGKPAMFPESNDVLAKLSEYDIPICIVSNIDNAVLDSALMHNKLDFEFVVTSEDCKSYKPNPEMFQKALSLLNLSNKEVLHVGDSLRADIRGAKWMEIPVLWLNRKNRAMTDQPEKPDFVSTDLNGIIDVLMKFY
ncbi:MAG: HAD family hydrolase [Candidatus Poribacteria bacterium]